MKRVKGEGCKYVAVEVYKEGGVRIVWVGELEEVVKGLKEEGWKLEGEVEYRSEWTRRRWVLEDGGVNSWVWIDWIWVE